MESHYSATVLCRTKCWTSNFTDKLIVGDSNTTRTIMTTGAPVEQCEDRQFDDETLAMWRLCVDHPSASSITGASSLSCTVRKVGREACMEKMQLSDFINPFDICLLYTSDAADE